MNTKRIQLLVALVLLLMGIAGLVHTALEQTLAHAAFDGVVVSVPSVAQVEAELKNLDQQPQLELQSGMPVRPAAPEPPTAPTPPPMPEVVVDFATWLGLTLLLFMPFALAGWYLDQRAQTTIYEQPLA
jgi:hypothetical protein